DWTSFIRRPEVRPHVMFLSDYDMNLTEHLVQGVDVWINTPRRPWEASGTSGMKVAFNGGLNMSVLDGWWCEGYKGNNGWAIGRGEVYDDVEYQNEVEGRAIYDLLEKEIVPLFYDRDAEGIPRGWIACMKASMQTLCPVFSTDRMVQEYTEHSYLSAFEQWRKLRQNDLALAVDLAAWKERMHRLWHRVRIEEIAEVGAEEVKVGSQVPISAKVHTGEIPPGEVAVDVYFGVLDSRGAIVGGELVSLESTADLGGGVHLFSGEIECRFCGRQGFMLRVMPRHAELGAVYEPGFLLWG
ncbi:MAG TPA: alpha-glucan family phosphorylase, partial [Geobacteraceae bacterium]